MSKQINHILKSAIEAHAQKQKRLHSDSENRTWAGYRWSSPLEARWAAFLDSIGWVPTGHRLEIMNLCLAASGPSARPPGPPDIFEADVIHRSAAFGTWGIPDDLEVIWIGQSPFETLWRDSGGYVSSLLDYFSREKLAKLWAKAGEKVTIRRIPKQKS